MSRINTTRYALLGMLTIKPMSGYDIKKEMQKTIAHFWSESDGQIYPILRTLEQEELVTVTLEPKGARPRKIYTITDAGRKVLQEWLELDPQPANKRSEFILKLFFGGNVTPEINVSHIRLHQQRMLDGKKMCEAALQKVETEFKDSDNYLYWLLTAKSGLSFVESQLAWCDEALRLLNQ